MALIWTWVPSLRTPHPRFHFRGGGVSPTCERGFTLLELLLALALLSILLGALYSTFFLSHKAMEGMDQSLVKLQECRMALDTLCREIESISEGRDGKNFLFKIEDRDLYGKQASRLALVTFSPLLPGTSTVSYGVEEMGGNLTLLKRVHSTYGSEAEAKRFEVLEGIDAFLVEARDGSGWARTWDASERKGLPDEVRITITVSLKDRRLSFFERARPQIGRPL